MPNIRNRTRRLLLEKTKKSGTREAEEHKQPQPKNHVYIFSSLLSFVCIQVLNFFEKASFKEKTELLDLHK